MPLINTRGAASIKGFGFAGFSPTVPGMPTSVSASATSSSAISVSFTAPACNGGLSIDYYQAVCTATGTHSATGSSPISVTGLCASTSYTFKVRAHNSLGYGSYSSSTGTATTTAVTGSALYATPGAYTWYAPTSVTTVSAVAVGGGQGGKFIFVGCCGAYFGWGGGGGGLGYKNNKAVTPGSGYTVQVGAGTSSHCTSSSGNSYFCSHCLVAGNAGCCSYPGAGYVGDGGGYGGTSPAEYVGYGGSGGAGGYSGNGGRGCYNPGTCGSGGGGGASGSSSPYASGGGGGVGVYGQGANGAGGTTIGYGGSGGANGSPNGPGAPNGGAYGGGAGNGGTGANGAVRIVYPGSTRQFPSTSVGSP